MTQGRPCTPALGLWQMNGNCRTADHGRTPPSRITWRGRNHQPGGRFDFMAEIRQSPLPSLLCGQTGREVNLGSHTGAAVSYYVITGMDMMRPDTCSPVRLPPGWGLSHSLFSSPCLTVPRILLIDRDHTQPANPGRYQQCPEQLWCSHRVVSRMSLFHTSMPRPPPALVKSGYACTPHRSIIMIMQL